MKITFKAEEFINELDLVRRFVGRGLHNAVVMDATGGDQLQLRATGAGINLRMPSACVEVVEPGTIIMSMDGLQVLRHVTGDTTMKATEKQVRLTGPMDLPLNLMDVPLDVFYFPDSDVPRLLVPPQFGKLLYAEGDPQQFRNALWIDGDIAACGSGERFAIYHAPDQLCDGQVAIRSDYAKLMDGGSFGLDRSRVWLDREDGGQLTFPLYGALMSSVIDKLAWRPADDYHMEIAASLVVDRAMLASTLNVMFILSTSAADRGGGVSISVGSPLVIRAKGNELGQGDRTLPARHEGEELVIGESSRYLLDALAQIDAAEVTIQFWHFSMGEHHTVLMVFVDDTVHHIVSPRV